MENWDRWKWIKNLLYALLSWWLPLETFMFCCVATKLLLKCIFSGRNARFFYLMSIFNVCADICIGVAQQQLHVMLASPCFFYNNHHNCTYIETTWPINVCSYPSSKCCLEIRVGIFFSQFAAENWYCFQSFYCILHSILHRNDRHPIGIFIGIDRKCR